MDKNVQRSSLIISFAVASVGVLVLLVQYFFFWIKEDIGSSQVSALTQRKEYRSASNEPSTRLPSTRIVELELRYPRSLRENQGGEIELRYRKFAEGFSLEDPKLQLKREPLEKLDDDIEASIETTAFDITTPTLKSAIGTPLPIQYKWSVTPKKEGEYQILLNVSKLILDAANRSDSFVQTEFVTNGERKSIADERYVTMDIRVGTKWWGLPQIVISIASAMSALIGAVLGYDVVKLWLRKRLGLEQSGSKGR